MGPLFSIITVVLNDPNGIRKTAESIQVQTEYSYEWIVVDGLSVDDTCEVIRKYQVQGRDTLVSERDSGVYHAMNKGLNAASGEFVVFLNAGDRLYKSTVLADVKEVISPTIDVIHGDVVFDTERVGYIVRHSVDSTDGINRRVFASHQSVFIRRLVHLSHQFNTDFHYAADYAVFSSLYMSGFHLHYLSEPLSITDINKSSLSVKNRYTMARENYVIDRSILKDSYLYSSLNYFQAFIKITIVRILLILPGPLFRALPKKITKKVY